MLNLIPMCHNWILNMNREFLEESEYAKIVQNQGKTLEELEKTNTVLTNANELSDKFIGEAVNNFRRGVTAIAHIRANLDEIHRALVTIAKAKSQGRL